MQRNFPPEVAKSEVGTEEFGFGVKKHITLARSPTFTECYRMMLDTLKSCLA